MGLLPVHGFVLAGGKSSRMGTDKALLEFCGRPLVAIAVEKLREFCAEVSIAGNREGLSGFAPVVLERREDAGPAAGIEAGLEAAGQEWVLFVPVDVPLVPVELLRRWTAAVIAGEGRCSYLRAGRRHQPTFCLVRREGLAEVTRELDGGERRVGAILAGAGAMIEEAESFLPERELPEFWFSNLNTAQEFAEAEAWARHLMENGRVGDL